MQALNYSLRLLLGLVALDAFMLGMVLVAIIAGADVQHVPFWDAQLRFVIGLFV